MWRKDRTAVLSALVSHEAIKREHMQTTGNTHLISISLCCKHPRFIKMLETRPRPETRTSHIYTKRSYHTLCVVRVNCLTGNKISDAIDLGDAAGCQDPAMRSPHHTLPRHTEHSMGPLGERNHSLPPSLPIISRRHTRLGAVAKCSTSSHSFTASMFQMSNLEVFKVQFRC
jgi:hypothetical protein